MKLAIVEDERSIIDAIQVAFEFRWPEAKVVFSQTGKGGVELVRKERPDIVILDINLPDISGFNVLKEVRSFSTVPVIILTVRSDDADVLRGLEAGADDYVTKPFNYMTLLARVKAVLRRSESVPLAEPRETAVSPRLKIDFVSQRVSLDNQSVELTPVEYRLLVLLTRNKGKVVPFDQIMREIWGTDFQGDTENIRIYVRRLRKKLRDIPPQMIVSQHGTGYLFRGDPLSF